MMVWQAQSQRTDSCALQHPAQCDLAFPAGVPLGKNHHGQVLSSCEKSAPHRIVFWVWTLNRAGKLQYIAVEIISLCLGAGKKRRAVQQGVPYVAVQYR